MPRRKLCSDCGIKLTGARVGTDSCEPCKWYQLTGVFKDTIQGIAKSLRTVPIELPPLRGFRQCDKLMGEEATTMIIHTAALLVAYWYNTRTPSSLRYDTWYYIAKQWGEYHEGPLDPDGTLTEI